MGISGGRELGSSSLEYTYEELCAATGSFSPRARIASGRAGEVHRGVLRGGTEVAVKAIMGNMGAPGFEEELQLLSRFRHPNLVTLMGWGQRESDRYLVYELLSGGDVGRKLWRSRSSSEPFLWRERLHAACDAVCGLSHMANSRPQAFHRDIKPPNIVLDGKGTAKMADFGLASVAPSRPATPRAGEFTDSGNVSGTPGYACPTYIATGRVGEQSEVFSFGVTLLELLTNILPAVRSGEWGGALVYPLADALLPWTGGANERVLVSLDPLASWPRPLADELTEVALRCVGPLETRPLFDRLTAALRRLCSGEAGDTGGCCVASAIEFGYVPPAVPELGGMPAQLSSATYHGPAIPPVHRRSSKSLLESAFSCCSVSSARVPPEIVMNCEPPVAYRPQ